jgi:hypothetical protein
MQKQAMKRWVSLALMIPLFHGQSALSATTATGSKQVRPVFDHNFNRAVYGNKPIVTPRTNVLPARTNINLQDRTGESDLQHLTFVGHAGEPVSVEKGEGERHENETGKEKDVRILKVGKAKETEKSKDSEQTSQAKENLDNVIDQNWATWTADSHGVLTMAHMAVLLRDPSLTASELSALGALAGRIEHMQAVDFSDHKISSGQVLSLVKGKDGEMVLRDGTKADARHLDMNVVADHFTSSYDRDQVCDSLMRTEFLQYWSQWTASSGGVMTFAQFNQLCKQTHPPITGPEAAALSALGNQLNNMQVAAYKVSDKAPLVTLKLQVTNGAVSLVDGKGDAQSTGTVAYMIYAPGVRMLSQDTHQPGQPANPANQKQTKLSLYGPTGKIEINDVRQGYYNDCFFLSGIWSAMNSHGVSYVQNMIKQTGPDRFEVSFPGYAHNPIEVHITPTEAVMFSGTTNGGCYLSVLALAADHISVNRTQGTSKLHDELTPMYAIINCGYDCPFLQLLTGQQYQNISSGSKEFPKLQPAIQAALSAHEPVNVATSDHYMTITAMSNNLSGLTNYVGPPGAPGPYVTIHNQWGDSGGYPLAGTHPPITVKMENGYFTLPLADFEHYGLIGIQVPGGQAKVEAPQIAGSRQGKAEIHIDRSRREHETDRSSRETERSSRLADEPSKHETRKASKTETVGSSAGSSAASTTGKSISRMRYRGSGDGAPNTAPIDTDEDKNGAVRQLEMVNGSVFIAHVNPVNVTIPGGSVKIAPDTAVYISRRGNACAVFNLTETNRSAVVVTADGKDRSVPVGQALIISSDTSGDFVTINPCTAVVDPARVKLIDSTSAVRTFAANYSPVAVLDNSPQFAELVKSKSPADRALANRVLKTAAVMSQMAPQQ